MQKSASARRVPRLGRKGLAAVEFALVASMLFMTMIAIMDVSRYYLTTMAARTVVAQAARALMITPSAVPLNARTCNDAALIASAGGMSFVRSTGNLCVTVSKPVPADPTRYRARVELSAPYNFVVATLGVGSVTIFEDQSFDFAN